MFVGVCRLRASAFSECRVEHVIYARSRAASELHRDVGVFAPGVQRSHRSRWAVTMTTSARLQRLTLRYAALIALGVWAATLFGAPNALQAEERVVLPPAQSIEPHSAVDVRTLEAAPSTATPPGKAPVEVPLHIPDPQALRQWRDLVQRHPNLVRPPSNDVVLDPAR